MWLIEDVSATPTTPCLLTVEQNSENAFILSLVFFTLTKSMQWNGFYATTESMQWNRVIFETTPF